MSAAARLTSLELRDFRNLAHLDVAVPEQGLAVIGENGHGKTNLLEAIQYLELLRSPRGARDIDLVRFGAPGFHIEGSLPHDRTVSVGFDRATRAKQVRLDGSRVERFSDAIGAVPAVMVAPADVSLLTDGPAGRRRYLDILLALSSRGYLGALQSYRAALLRRNAALRDASRRGRSAASVAVWDGPLAEYGGALWCARATWVSRVADRFASLCSAIGEPATAALRYVPVIDAGRPPSEAILAALEAKRDLDLRHGVTHAGPHRDDLAISLAGHDLRVFGSAGQQRSAAIALRLLEWETLREARGITPMLLLDDPFAELDPRRSARIIDLLRDMGTGQTMLAVPRADEIPHEFTRLDRRYMVSGALHERSVP